MSYTFDNELAARRYMADMVERGWQVSYWNRSVCEHVVTLN